MEIQKAELGKQQLFQIKSLELFLLLGEFELKHWHVQEIFVKPCIIVSCGDNSVWRILDA